MPLGSGWIWHFYVTNSEAKRGKFDVLVTASQVVAGIPNKHPRMDVNTHLIRVPKHDSELQKIGV